MGNSLEQAIRDLHHTENITYYTDTPGGRWQNAKQGCVPSNAWSIRTSLGRYWDKADGWLQNEDMIKSSRETIKPEDPRHPMNAENAHYKFFLKGIAKMPEDMRKQFYNIRDHLDKQTAAEKEFEKFFADVELGLSAYSISPDKNAMRNLKAILKDSYGKFK